MTHLRENRVSETRGPDFLTVDGHRLEYAEYPGRDPALVFLHEGLGCLALWRNFPARIAAATGLRCIVYSRYGYGQSDIRDKPVTIDYMHREADAALPALLQALDIRNPILIGHSDGASIALLAAGLPGVAPKGLVVMAPHVFVEEISIASIRAAGKAFADTDMKARMARYHRDPEKTFRGWHDAWLLPAFRDWNIEACLPSIDCPTLAIQGEDDEYGTLAQLDAVAAGTASPCEVKTLSSCGHAPHKDQPERTEGLMIRFIEELVERTSGF